MSNQTTTGYFAEQFDKKEVMCPFCGNHGEGVPLSCFYTSAAEVCRHYAEFKKKELSSARRPGVSGFIAERQSIHGVFSENSKFMQEVKDLMRRQPNWEKLEPHQREGLDMIAHNMGRLLHGDPRHRDHWNDIAGYAERVAGYLGGGENK